MKKLGPSRICRFTIGKILKEETHRRLINKYITDPKASWSDKYLSEIKNKIRVELRRQQDGRCVFCRRPIKVERRNAIEDIEHFLDKSKKEFRVWSFSSLNLSLACHPCNLEKSTRNMLQKGCQQTSYPKDPDAFVWLHPVLDDYHSNIEIHKGWIYEAIGDPSSASYHRSLKMIRDCKLDQVELIEQRNEHIKAGLYELLLLMEKLTHRQDKKRSTEIVCNRLRKLIEDNWFSF